jgi:hypothetical protein
MLPTETPLGKGSVSASGYQAWGARPVTACRRWSPSASPERTKTDRNDTSNVRSMALEFAIAVKKEAQGAGCAADK